MDPFFLWIEGSWLSVWLREAITIWAFPFVLVLHTIGLAFMVGVNVAIDLRALGGAMGVPTQHPAGALGATKLPHESGEFLTWTVGRADVRCHPETQEPRTMTVRGSVGFI